MTASKKSRAKVQARVTLSSKTSLPETLPPNKLPQANRAMIEQSLSVGMGRALGIRLKKLSRTRIDAEMLGAMGTLANLPEGYRTTTLESKTNFFAAGVGDTLGATALPLHIGRTTMVWQTTIKNLDGTRVAIVTQTQIVIPRKT